jgi:predicted AAA+ superfamily ATPase
MHKVSEKNESGGSLEVLEDFNKNFLLLKPHGIINPTLLEEDLKRARSFSQKVKGEWSYVTNTEDVRLVNPANLLYLKEVKKLKKLKQIIIFAPGFFNRMLVRMSAFIIKPDKVIKDRNEFNRTIANLH